MRRRKGSARNAKAERAAVSLLMSVIQRKNEVAGLQRIGGGGGFSISRADPLLVENKNQTSELKGLETT